MIPFGSPCANNCIQSDRFLTLLLLVCFVTTKICCLYFPRPRFTRPWPTDSDVEFIPRLILQVSTFLCGGEERGGFTLQFIPNNQNSLSIVTKKNVHWLIWDWIQFDLEVWLPNISKRSYKHFIHFDWNQTLFNPFFGPTFFSFEFQPQIRTFSNDFFGFTQERDMENY